MGTAPMHEGELAIDAALVRALVDSQFPRWSTMPLARVESAGTDNAMFRLGESLVVRLPRLQWELETAQEPMSRSSASL